MLFEPFAFVRENKIGDECQLLNVTAIKATLNMIICDTEGVCHLIYGVHGAITFSTFGNELRLKHFRKLRDRRLTDFRTNVFMAVDEKLHNLFRS